MKRAFSASATARIVAAAALATATVAGCKAHDNGTSLVVNVLSDLRVPDQIDKVEVDVVSDSHADGGMVTTESFALTSNTSPLGRLAIRPKGAPGFGVRVTARGLKGNTIVVTQRAAVSFVPDEAWQFDIILSSDCTGAAATCSNPMLVCIKGGSCVSETTVATLRPFPGADNDAGVVDTGRDVGRDVGGPTLGTWKVAASPNVPATATLNKVWPIAASDVWVVGATGARGVAYHYDGTAWTAVAPPTTTSTLYAVWASAADDVWAVGTGGTILHYSNPTTGWLPSISGTNADLSGIWGFAANDITAVGTAGVVVHWNGTSWATVAAGITANLSAITGSGSAGSGPGDLWAVGSNGAVYRNSANTWQAQPHGQTTSLLLAVWASSATNVWAAGLNAALHLSGTTWTLSSGTPGTTLGVWGSGEDDVWAVGSAGTASAISHWNGSAWSAVTTPAGTGLQSVRGTTPGDVWAVGNGGQILHYQNSP